MPLLSQHPRRLYYPASKNSIPAQVSLTTIRGITVSIPPEQCCLSICIKLQKAHCAANEIFLLARHG
jgi:hypothetical protein